MKDFKNYLSGNAFTLTEGRQAWQTKSGGQVRSYTSNVSKVSTVSEVSKMSKQGAQQSPHSLRTLGEGGRRPDEGADVVRSYMETAKEVRSTFEHTLAPCGRGMRAAFTLAEVLITLAVIGVVAVLTIPGLIKNHNEKAWSTAQDVFTKRLEVATRQMNTEEKLAGYDNTMDFVNELKKYIKITRVCDNNEITKCFDKEVIWNEGDEPVDMSAIKNAQNFGLDWESDTVAVQFANGVNAVIAYNPNATQDPFNNQFNATSNSMAILYDVSGNKNPNTNGKDINHINVTELAGTTGCMIPELADIICITRILPAHQYNPLNKNDCNDDILNKYGMQYCFDSRRGYQNDYWAGAVIACEGVNNMPTREQLGKLAMYIYNTDREIGAGTNIGSGLSKDPERVAPFGTGDFFIWSNEEINEEKAYQRYYSFNGTYGYSSNLNYERNTSSYMAICVTQN